MSDYGLNFGFRRSDETMRTAEGRFRTPAGSALLLGTMVEIDPANPGYLKQSASDAAVITGFSGLLLQELDFDRSIYESNADALDSFQKGVALPARLSVITSGAGVKVWFKNTAGITRADGRTVNARTVATVTGVAVGDVMGWDGTKWVETGTLTNGVMKVTDVNTTTNYFEATLLA